MTEGCGVLLLGILVGLYLLVAAIAVTCTLVEWRETREASALGALAGCVLCLFWLPMIVAMGLYQAWGRSVRARRDALRIRMSEI
jgi:hypothetical protein